MEEMIRENYIEGTEKKRSSLLTVLCILSFIGSGWDVLSGGTKYLVYSPDSVKNSVMQSLEVVKSSLDDDAGGDFFTGILNGLSEFSSDVAVHFREITLCGTILALLSLVGAVLMFRLKKQGFYLYAIVNVLALFIMPLFLGFTAIVLLRGIFPLIITVTFIILYASRLKEMN